MNRAERRAAAKQSKALNRFDKACKRYEKEAKRVAYHEINLMWAGCFLALHRKYGWGRIRCLRLYDEIKAIMVSAMSAEDLRKKCKDECKIDVEKIVSSEEDVEEELRRSDFSEVEVERWEM